MPEESASYAAAGVDLEAADEAVRRIGALAASTARPGVMEGIGGFGGSFALDTSHMEQPVLVSSTDGVGTKLAVAQAAHRFDTVGIDLVAMCADDLVCVGAEPLFMLDYIATGHIDPAQIEILVSGIAQGCRQAGCALLGGELAEHPGEMEHGKFDMAGFAVGVVDRDKRIGPDLVKPGDTLIGIRSPGLRSNGYSLARNVLLERAGLPLDGPAWQGALHSLADEMLRPSVIYTPAVLAAVRTGFVHAAAHITGGGIPGNLIRVLPDGCEAVVDRSAWTEPAVFGELRRLGNIPDDEMERVFNLGIGMVLVVVPDGVDEVTSAIVAASEPRSSSETGGSFEAAGPFAHGAAAGVAQPVVIGTVRAGSRGVRIVGGS
ncbi:MAG: phosphoribosylformylglycinamidine cyclo-ligase [Acidimicrobiales bacterium]